eukprot:10080327-Ditylum_brightwellii.AAC.1
MQAATMEHNQKLQLEANKALILKIFENKLPTLFSCSTTDSSAIKMLILMQDTWLPGIPLYKHWETSNQLGGLTVAIQDQIGMVERQIRESINMNLPSYLKACL